MGLVSRANPTLQQRTQKPLKSDQTLHSAIAVIQKGRGQHVKLHGLPVDVY